MHIILVMCLEKRLIQSIKIKMAHHKNVVSFYGALPSAIENTIKDVSLKYVTEYTLAVINTVY